MEYSGQCFRILGAQVIGREGGKYESHFGISPRLTSLVFRLVKAQQGNNDLKPKYLLWCLKLMKVYAKADVLADSCGVHKDTFGPRAWSVMQSIAKLKPKIIKLKNRFMNRRRGNACMMTIDTTDFRIQDRRPFWSGWKSKNFKGAGVKYEVGICIQTGWIVWICGPFPCGAWHDLTVFRYRLKNLLLEGEMVEGDKAYRDPKCRAPGDYLTEMQRIMKEEVRGRHETGNHLFKVWGILGQRFRHPINKHKTATDAVAVLTQLAIQEGELTLFDVDYDI